LIKDVPSVIDSGRVVDMGVHYVMFQNGSRLRAKAKYQGSIRSLPIMLIG